MEDLTVIMLTPNLVPKEWAKYHREKLMEAIGDTPIITISKEPLDWGTNLLQTEYGFTNIFRQMLKGAKLATTPWIAMADDDTLYPKQHFEFRPKEAGFYYNLNRWHIFTWGDPFYFHKPRPGNGLMICSRESLMNALEGRFRRHRELPPHLSHELGTRGRALRYDKIWWKPFYTSEPILSFYHTHALSATRTRIYPVRAYDIPVWGRAEDIRKKFR